MKNVNFSLCHAKALDFYPWVGLYFLQRMIQIGQLGQVGFGKLEDSCLCISIPAKYYHSFFTFFALAIFLAQGDFVIEKRISLLPRVQPAYALPNRFVCEFR